MNVNSTWNLCRNIAAWYTVRLNWRLYSFNKREWLSFFTPLKCSKPIKAFTLTKFVGSLYFSSKKFSVSVLVLGSGDFVCSAFRIYLFLSISWLMCQTTSSSIVSVESNDQASRGVFIFLAVPFAEGKLQWICVVSAILVRLQTIWNYFFL